MPAKKLRPRFKPIDEDAEIYHHYEYSPTEFGLFDDADDGSPVMIGSRNLIDAMIRKLPKNITIFYYKRHQLGYWEKKMIYNGDKNK